MSSDTEEAKYRNFYRHYGCPEAPKGERPPRWEDVWSCMCNDRCPYCNAETEPYKSEELK